MYHAKSNHLVLFMQMLAEPGIQISNVDHFLYKEVE